MPYMKKFRATAASRYTACFDTAENFRRTVEVHVALPVAIVVHTAAVKPMALNPIDHVL